MKILFSIFFPLFLLLAHSTPEEDVLIATSVGSFDATICGDIPPLCEGQCTSKGTDLLLKINGGTPPYKIGLTFNYNPTSVQPTSTYIIQRVNTTHVIRFCHDNNLTSPGGEELPGDTTIFKIPSTYLDANILFRTMEDADLCVSTDFAGTNPSPITTLGGTFTDYQVNIPNHVCDSLRLPEIMPLGTSARFYTESRGNGSSFAPGDVIDFDDINLPTGDLFDTLYVYDPSDICNSEALFPFEINISPNHILPTDISQCEPYTLLPYPGPVSTPAAQYASSRNFEPSSLLDPGSIINSDQWIYLQDGISYSSGRCDFLDSFYVEILTAPNAGSMTTYEVCVGETTIIADPLDLLEGNPETGGAWSGTMIPDVDFSNPFNIDVSHMTEGLRYVLNYTIEKPGCPLASTMLILEAVAPPFAGDSTEIFLCSAEGPQDMFALIGEPELGGTWDQKSGQLVVFSDLRQADFRILPEDLYTFTYTLPASGSCPQKVAELKVVLSAGANAGDDNVATVCLGDSLDVSSLLSADAQLSGEYKADGFIPVPNGIWYSDGILLEQGQNSREILLDYIISSNSPSCPSDTASFVITVIKQPFAGLPLQSSFLFCEGERIRLEELLEGEDSGGSFFILPDLVTASSPNINLAGDTTNVAYIVPGTTNCPPDTSYMQLTTVSSLEVNISHPISTCRDENSCLTITLGTERILSISLDIADQNGNLGTVNVQESTYIICPYAGEDLVFPQDTFFAENNSTELSFSYSEIVDPLGICETQTSTITSPTVRIFENYNDTIRGSVCEGMTTNINGKEYGSSTIERATSQFGCDSIVNIIIDTFPQETGLIEDTYCSGTPVDILNMTFVEDTDEIVIFPGQSAFGCDSIAQVKLTFTDVAIPGTLDTMICEGDFAIIEGEVFDQDRLTGEVDYLAGSTGGCDSIIQVSLSFLAPGIRVIDTTLCQGDFLVIEGDSYDENTPSGTTTLLTPAANNCDSIAQVNVNFENSLMDNRTYRLCTSESLSLGGMVFDAENASGIALIEGTIGCDTLATVTLEFISADTIYIQESICKDDSLEVNGIIYHATNLEGNSSISSSRGCDSIYYEVALDILTPDGDILVTELADNTFELEFSTAVMIMEQTWQSDAELDCTDDCSPIVTITDDTEVFLNIVDSEGCTYQESILLQYTEVMVPDSTFKIYNTNLVDLSSSQNDIFYIQSSETVLISSLRIYDRWGNEVFVNESFMSNDPANGWDGRKANSKIEQGAYVYILEYEDHNLRPHQTIGSLTILR